jgi:hypothetical protein
MLVDETEKKIRFKKNQVNSCELCKLGLISQTHNPLNCRPRFN